MFGERCKTADIINGLNSMKIRDTDTSRCTDCPLKLQQFALAPCCQI